MPALLPKSIRLLIAGKTLEQPLRSRLQRGLNGGGVVHQEVTTLIILRL